MDQPKKISSDYCRDTMEVEVGFDVVEHRSKWGKTQNNHL